MSTKVYQTPKFDNFEFLLALHESLEDSQIISLDKEILLTKCFPSASEDSFLESDAQIYQREQDSLWTLSSDNRIFAHTGFVGEIDTNLLNQFRPLIAELPKNDIDIKGDPKEKVSFSVFEPNMYHKLPKFSFLKIKKASGELII